MSSKYDPLQTHLEAQSASEIPMKFKEIEAVIGKPLPPSAYKHRPWWSNNPSNSVITHAWLRAGYETCKVDMGSQKLVFRRRAAPARPPVPGGPQTPQAGAKPAPDHRDGGRRTLFGALRGMVRFASPGAADAPTGERWNADLDRL